MTTSRNDPLLFTGGDMKRLLMRHRRRIAAATIVGGLAAFVFLLFREPTWLQEATFRQSARQNEPSFNMKEMFQQFVAQPSENSMVAVMLSKSVLRGVIEELGMQVECSPDSWITEGAGRIWENLCAEFGTAPEDHDRFVFTNVLYSGEKPLKMFVKSTGDGIYQLLDRNQRILGQGSVGVQSVIPGGHLTLHHISANARENRIYPLWIHPLEKIIACVRKRLRIAPLKQDKGILKIQFHHRDRILGSDFVNRLMLGCQNYLRRENREICQEQYKYIQKREEELTKNFDLALSEHVAYLRENLTQGGFMGFAQEVEVLSEPKNLYTSRLFDVDLELGRLRHDRICPVEKVQQSCRNEERQNAANSSFPKAESRRCMNSLEVCVLEEERMMGSRDGKLALQETEEDHELKEISGLSLKTAQDLLVEYTRHRDSLQAQMRELVYLRDQMGKPDFEMSSLGGVIDDPVTKDIVNKAGAAALQLKDENNRSLREQERLVETLQTQKSFLSHHLLQTCDLRQLRIKLLGDKISSLQQETLSLLETEKQLIKNRLEELNKRMSDLPEKWRRESLLSLKKALGTAMIEGISQLAETKSLSQHMFQVNSRPLDGAFPPLNPQSQHMLLMSCLFAVLTGAGCFFLNFWRALCRGLPVSEETLKMFGFRVGGTLSPHCNTHLADVRDTDLETLRRLAESLLNGGGPTIAVCIGGKYPDYSLALAELLSLRGLKILVIQGVFDQSLYPNAIPGLWQYLQGQTKDLPLNRHLTCDILPSGTTSRHGTELLCSTAFQNLLTAVKHNYDVVLVFSSADAASAEGYSLLKMADAAIITVQQEKKEDIAVYNEWALQKRADCATFVCAEEVF